MASSPGPFTASSNGQYLGYLSSQKSLTQLNGELIGEFRAIGERLQTAAPGSYARAVVDPASGALLGVYVERPGVIQRIEEGEVVVYVIVAVDTSFNRSAESAEIAATAEAREVAVTFTVTVPPNTPADDTVYIAGDFQDWNPGGTPMERVDAATWSITLPFTEGEPPQYKYTRGTWEAVEKDAACGELANRTVTVTFGEGGTADVADTVEKWRDVDSCP